MQLDVWILNVDHGDSIVLHYQIEKESHFAVIDSNRTPRGVSALKKLSELDAKKLSFIVLTHPHADHYSGLVDVVKQYKSNIECFYSYPINHTKPDQLKKVSRIYQSLYHQTDSLDIRRKIKELVELFVLAKNDNIEWHEPTGPLSRIYPPGFDGVEIEILLPLARVKGQYFQNILNGEERVVEGMKENELSLALRVTYGGTQFILGGDGCFTEWMEHKRQIERGGGNLHASCCKLPHHGSMDDCRKDVLDHIYDSDNENNYAFISANGRTHPASETLSRLDSMGVKPYCTNLAKQCGANLNSMVSMHGITPRLRSFLQSVSNEPSSRSKQVCQGDICISMDIAGGVSIKPQVENPCPYRGGYDFLLH